MAQDNTLAAINSIAKPIFAAGVTNLVPDDLYLIKKVKFSAQQRLGRYFEYPVILSDEQGFTYADEDDGLYDLDDSVSMTVKSAEIVSQQVTGRSAFSLKEAAVALAKGEQAFANNVQLRVQNLSDSAAKRLEIAMIYGRSSTGLARSVTGTTVSSTQFRFDIPASQWASGIWAGSLNAKLECFNDTGTQVGAASVQVYNVDMSTNRYVYVTGTSGDVTAINAAIGTGIVLRFKTANNKEMYGLEYILRNNSTLFGISAADYPLWKGNTYSVGSAALTMQKLLKSLNDPMGKGLRRDIVVLLSNPTFGNLNQDEAALRMFDSSYKPEMTERGNKRIKYYYQHGSMEIVCHPMVKEGDFFALPLDIVKRVGATDLTFRYPGMSDEEMFSPFENKNGYQVRIYADQAIFLERPGIAVYGNGIVNS